MPYKDPAKNRACSDRWHERHLEQVRAYNAAWQTSHPEQVRAAGRRYAAANRDKRRAKDASYRSKNVAKLQASHAAYREANREKQRAYAADRRISHRDILLAIEARYRQKNHEKELIRYATRRARKLSLPSTLTDQHWLAIKAAYKQRCAYCGSKPKVLTQDHVIPITKGGGSTPDNIVPACASCNSAKRDRPPVVIPAIRLLI